MKAPGRSGLQGSMHARDRDQGRRGRGGGAGRRRAADARTGPGGGPDPRARRRGEPPRHPSAQGPVSRRPRAYPTSLAWRRPERSRRSGRTCSRWRAGDRVCALLGGGGYAEYAVVDARHVLPVPAGLDFVQAAALPETAFTVFTNVFEDGRLKAGETLLVHGATSGIGVMAIQAARAAGARVIATSRGADKAKAARDLGADVSIDASDGRFLEAVAGRGRRRRGAGHGGRRLCGAEPEGAEARRPLGGDRLPVRATWPRWTCPA